METEGPTVGLWHLLMSPHHISVMFILLCMHLSVCGGTCAMAEDNHGVIGLCHHNHFNTFQYRPLCVLGQYSCQLSHSLFVFLELLLAFIPDMQVEWCF